MAAQYKLEQLMRWYGPNDAVKLNHIAQAGCTGVVTALHDIPVGHVWSKEAIQARIDIVEAYKLTWTVVESLPVHEEIKTGKGNCAQWIENYKISLQNLGDCGIKVVTYNFMPVLDWVRTNVEHLMPNGSEALFFNKDEYDIFDLFMLKRAGAQAEHSPERIVALQQKMDEMPASELVRLRKTVLLGLPGSDVPFTEEEVLALLETYKDITRDKLKANLTHFLNEVCPIAESVGIGMAIHPDDPPYSVLGLSRIMSCNQDVEDIMAAVPNPANGLCFCTGSFGARPDNNLPEMLKRWGSRVHFLHIRNTKRDANGNFFEANHLEGDTDMYAIVDEALAIMQREGRSIPMRPDHGHKMLDDIGKVTYPGYSAIGRLKGLAEIRGLEYALARKY